ncbi:U1 small nuclear ribonucleoprotein 70 kDa isoform 1-T1 [Lycaon pictus]|uniref:U1 small nuclear ribonucleoprotein 70 kDa n=3 Tax=Canis lupus familiaris TaxID=9615 RepID=A0A8C0NIR1_CANLF|nr:U1 small nuclear ribonucleoprotein 70 kDa isoform X1 [Canis lupus familiaris]XP_038384225.1 U1 small nuclear ribonucleoprotein 70 kDa isoform X1 [Canis lupus familiaris]XP_038512305.1 U1 small nuclear ribonucleoprotein 70 kDa isoform X1 [Canis lupus familiaris]XP_038512306.1 U1 small nuclear ribonucleoprotein 70 kDa isoform X1 [Canis lupus familiaris]XP_048949773.1 U1 small nuclear ribonucleoprotein 70 kDa isoform X1 [Canis lupus dingo]XP_048949774.1 U1 small nuclear ribonucleoprotein 70 kD|eukprot:XP_005616386.1 U1 small nuclear ribonucleoprotein 70 kDa isoform X1 [Canis lupus familiaris]
MTQFLPPNLLALFAPRDPIPYLPPLEKLPHEKHHNQPYCGIAPYIREFEDPRDAPPPTRAETREERMERKRREKIERRQQEVETELKMWDPHNDPNAQGDAFKTLFVARVNYDTTESKLRREFEVYGPIKRIHMVYSKRSGKPRGYAFIEYEHERDMHSAYKHADGKKIDGRRVLVDVERGRTVKGWRPRRLGGGLGGTRRGGADVNIRHSGRDDTSRYDERPGPSPLPHRDRDRDRERERRERSRERDKERERRRSRSRDRRRRSRSRDKEERRRSRERSKDKDRERKRRSSRSRERARRERERKEELRGGGGGGGDMAEPSEAGDAPPDDGPPGELGPDGPDGPEEKGRDRDRERRRSHRSERERRRDRDRDRDREHKRGERGGERGRDEARGGGGGGQDNGLEGLGNESRDMYMESEGGDGYLAPENGYLMEAAPE